MVESSLFDRLECHRAAFGLLWEDPKPGRRGRLPPWTIHLERTETPGGRGMRSCSCGKRGTCSHQKEVSRAVREFRKILGSRSWQDVFERTVWYRFAKVLFEGKAVSCSSVGVEHGRKDGGATLRFYAPSGELVARYFDDETAALLLARVGPGVDPAMDEGRAGLLHRLARLQETRLETRLRQRGGQTQQQAWEGSFWYRLAYHCVREWGAKGGTFHPRFDESSGELTFFFRSEENGDPVVEVALAPDRALRAFRVLGKAFPEQRDLALHPTPLEEVVLVSGRPGEVYDARPAIRVRLEGACEDTAAAREGATEGCEDSTREERLVDEEGWERFRYGDLLYLPELGLVGEIARRDRSLRFPVMTELAPDDVPPFLDAHRAELEAGIVVRGEGLRGRRVFTDYDSVPLSSEETERSWFWISARYGFGGDSVDLHQILRAKRQRRAYLETPGGWVDLGSPALERLDALADTSRDKEGGDGRFRLSARDLLLLRAAVDRPFELDDATARARVLERLFALRPAEPFSPPAGLTSPLRPYQILGVDWLRFLWENRLGGLLCDDMGLGKTHQAMALLVSLSEQEGVEAPFLVVSPTTVISHWRNKIRDHAPALRARLHHGSDRPPLEGLEPGEVVVTSYGLLRRDLEELSRIPFAVVIFDEIQYLKNRETQSHQAARLLSAEMRIGLTGTPIENSIDELEALFALVLPGYLGSERAFQQRFGWISRVGLAEEDRLRELRRFVAPFVLRRLKEQVLDELPEKIEDVRTCTLSPEQVEQYRSIVKGRGERLLEQLEHEDEPAPYIHVFAVLNLLKQICDHPALALGRIDEADRHESGKWNLYREILRECLDSGQKVVVFTQYLGMIELMSRHLDELGTDYVTLTGSSRGRGEIIDRFNSDPRCRVFLGSLKAGGTGIDLVGGSVVIHYDRWWNAAREDQATDRVHRIGQRRAVQVFKLLTEGTLEEKIHAIIERKRQLMETVVQEDHPELAKVFSRDELADLLRAPESGAPRR